MLFVSITGDRTFMKEKPDISSLLVPVTMWLALMTAATPTFADNAVKLKVLIITTGDVAQDPGYAYIKPVLDEMGVPHDVLNAETQDLAAEMLASSAQGACKAAEAGCVGNYNGIILTDSDLVPNFSPAEWEILHGYEQDFGVREAVLSGWPGTYWDPNPPYGIYLDYGLVFSSAGKLYDSKWTVPEAYSKQVFEYVNQANDLRITDFAFAATPRKEIQTLRDGTVPKVEPLLRTQNGEALVSVVRYMTPVKTTPVREVMISTITNSPQPLHSKVLAYEFINWATQGIFVGARFVHMAAHLDDLFLGDHLWDPSVKGNNLANIYRLNGTDIDNAVSKQGDLIATHPLAGGFKLDFPFNGYGAVVDPTAMTLATNLADELVSAVIANKNNFRFINHTFSHRLMDKTPVPAEAPCDYATFTDMTAVQAEISRNRTVWSLLGLPEQNENDEVLISGNHSGLKDNKCTIYPAMHPDMPNIQADDVGFDQGGANPLFLQAAASLGVKYLASDSSQQGQNIEQYITGYDDGSQDDRVMLPRWPTNVFYNATNPTLLTDEYNYLFHDRFVSAGQDPCATPGAICSPLSYTEILGVEADKALRRMLTFSKWPHYFHQSNLAKYDESGSTVLFDWLNAVFTAYERLFTLPVKNYPYYLIGRRTAESLDAKSTTVEAVWNRTTNEVTLSAGKALSGLLVTGLSGGELYGGQSIRKVNLDINGIATYPVDRALTQ
ncbi:MAG TPA: hypothetical protein VFI43_05030 [Nitrosospira sp.]|nr:hypothetical protein [Nitrosospira sp.]